MFSPEKTTEEIDDERSRRDSSPDTILRSVKAIAREAARSASSHSRHASSTSITGDAALTGHAIAPSPASFIFSQDGSQIWAPQWTMTISSRRARYTRDDSRR